jgi:hypothetical protein
MDTGSRSTAESTMVLHQIDRDKKQSACLIIMAIEGSWIGYANAMGLVYQETHHTESRQIVTLRDLRYALSQLILPERLAALYFITGYTRDVLYQQVLWGASHQEAVEDYVMDKMNATFAINRSDMKPGHKTCMGILYGQLYNRRKQKLHKSILPNHVALAVGRHGYPQPLHWKRPKTVYFVHTGITSNRELPTTTHTVESQMVSTTPTLLM